MHRTSVTQLGKRQSSKASSEAGSFHAFLVLSTRRAKPHLWTNCCWFADKSSTIRSKIQTRAGQLKIQAICPLVVVVVGGAGERQPCILCPPPPSPLPALPSQTRRWWNASGQFTIYWSKSFTETLAILRKWFSNDALFWVLQTFWSTELCPFLCRTF